MRPLLSLAFVLACMPALASDQLPAPSSAPVAAPQPAAPVDVAVSGVFDVMADLGRPVYVEALASSHLTGALRDLVCCVLAVFFEQRENCSVFFVEHEWNIILFI